MGNEPGSGSASTGSGSSRWSDSDLRHVLYARSIGMITSDTLGVLHVIMPRIASRGAAAGTPDRAVVHEERHLPLGPLATYAGWWRSAKRAPRPLELIARRQKPASVP